MGTEVELLLRRWQQLRVNALRLELGGERRTEREWSPGEVGQGIRSARCWTAASSTVKPKLSGTLASGETALPSGPGWRY